jgi:hypothetical protein
VTQPPASAWTEPVILTLCISVAALVVSILVFSWQVASWWLSGSRLKVELILGYLGADGSSVRYPTGRPTRKAPAWSKNFRRHTSDLGIEFAEVRVTNIGRTPVSVEEISFDLGRCSWRSLRRNGITPTLFYDPREAIGSDDDPRDLKSSYRLEPSANVTIAFNLWPVMAHHEFGTKAGKVRVRGSARAVGRRATRSKRRYKWKLPKNSITRFEDHPPSAELLVYRELWNHAYMDSVGEVPLVEHEEIIRRLKRSDTWPEIQAYLNEITSDRELSMSMLAHKLHSTYYRNRA